MAIANQMTKGSRPKETPLMMASGYKKSKMFKFLLGKDVNLDLKNKNCKTVYDLGNNRIKTMVLRSTVLGLVQMDWN